MKFNGINLLLILLAPVAVLLVIVLLIYPLQALLFDREKPLKKLLKDKRRTFRAAAKQKRSNLRKMVKETGARPSEEQLEEFSKEMKAMGKEYLASSWTTTKEIIRVHNEESGFSDLVREKVDNSAVFYIASMFLTVVGLPIALGLSAYVLPKSAGRETYLFLLVLPVIGCWLGYKGHMAQSQPKKNALVLSIVVNVFYAIFLTYGILRLGK